MEKVKVTKLEKKSITNNNDHLKETLSSQINWNTKSQDNRKVIERGSKDVPG